MPKLIFSSVYCNVLVQLFEKQRYRCSNYPGLVLVLFVVVLCLVYPMLPVSLDCPILIAPSVFSKV